MKNKFVVLALCLFFVGSTAFSATYYLPQVAIGSYSMDGSTFFSYQTTLVFFNNTDAATSLSIAFTDDDGNPMTANISGFGTSSVFSFQLGPGATRILRATGSGSIQTGAATITSTSESDIGVSGIYTITNRSTGQFITEVGVQAAPPTNSFSVPVQVTQDGFVNTGLALFNPAEIESGVTLLLNNMDGDFLGDTTLNLLPGEHSAFYVTDKFSSINGTTFSGMLTLQSDVQLSAVTLRQNAPSTVTYTSIPVVPTTSTQTTFNMAHFADGQVGGTPYKTSFLLFNFSSSTATVSISATGDDGTPLTLTMTDSSTTADDYTVEPGASKFLQTNGSANAWGAVVINSDTPIGAAALFTQYNTDQSFNTEAGVQDSPALTNFTLPVDSTVSLDGSITTSDTGIAFFNPGLTSVTFTPRFLNSSGIITTSETDITLPAKGHYANFFNALFPQMGNVQGSVSVANLSGSVSAMTLRLNSSPFSMTTLPVAEGVAPGFLPLTSGTPVRKNVTGIIAASDTTVDTKLPYGYAVTVTPTVTSGATIWAQGVTANSGGDSFPVTANCSGSWYLGIICTGTVTYRANLPPGSYSFRVQSYMGTQTSAYFSTYNSNLVTISSSGTVPVPVTFPTTYAVTGSISGVTNSSGHVVFSRADGSGSYAYLMTPDGGYTIGLASGTYNISYSTNYDTSTWPFGPFITNLGTVTVSDAPATAPDIVLPDLANISGAIGFPDAPPASITVTATDPSLSGYNNSSATATNGMYEALKVNPGIPYNLSLAYSVYASTSTTVASGTVNYAPTNNPFNIMGDEIIDFIMPGIMGVPELLTISGTVTDNADNPVSGVTVTATSSSLSDATSPGASYTSANATTDATGAYTLYIVAGSNYALTFSPPQQ
jgi:hypothetical protein